MDYYEELKSRLDFMHTDVWAKADPIKRGLIAVSNVSGALLTVYSGVRTPAEHAAMSTAIARVYEEVIAPLDIPAVGAFIERFIDANMPAVLGGMLDPLAGFLERLFPTPAIEG